MTTEYVYGSSDNPRTGGIRGPLPRQPTLDKLVQKTALVIRSGSEVDVAATNAARMSAARTVPVALTRNYLQMQTGDDGLVSFFYTDEAPDRLIELEEESSITVNVAAAYLQMEKDEVLALLDVGTLQKGSVRSPHNAIAVTTHSINQYKESEAA